MKKDKDEIWITKTGEKIPVGEMSERHAKNALRMILRKSRQAKKQDDAGLRAEFSAYMSDKGLPYKDEPLSGDDPTWMDID